MKFVIKILCLVLLLNSSLEALRPATCSRDPEINGTTLSHNVNKKYVGRAKERQRRARHDVRKMSGTSLAHRSATYTSLKVVPLDPEILLNAQHYGTEKDRTGSHGQASGHGDLNCQLTLRFQPEINEKATRLGDILIVEKKWSNIPLDSHPTPGEVITKTKIIDWMTQRLGHFNATWQGKTQIKVKPSSQSSGKLLVEKAKAALIKKLGTRYQRVEATPLSHLKNSEYAPDDFSTKIHITHPTSKRVCVWLVHDKTRIAVWFKVRAYTNVLIANQHIHYNTPLQNNEFSMKERNIAGLNSPPVLTLPKPMWLKSSMERNTILLKSQLKEPPLVAHGQHINVATHNHSITIVMDAIALADGYLGESITVKNPLNQKTFVAKINGVQRAEIIL